MPAMLPRARDLSIALSQGREVLYLVDPSKDMNEYGTRLNDSTEKVQFLNVNIPEVHGWMAAADDSSRKMKERERAAAALFGVGILTELTPQNAAFGANPDDGNADAAQYIINGLENRPRSLARLRQIEEMMGKPRGSLEQLYPKIPKATDFPAPPKPAPKPEPVRVLTPAEETQEYIKRPARAAGKSFTSAAQKDTRFRARALSYAKEKRLRDKRRKTQETEALRVQKLEERIQKALAARK